MQVASSQRWPLVTQVTTRSSRGVQAQWEKALGRTPTTLHGLARCTTCRIGCPVRQAHLIYGRAAWASNTFMGSSEATLINGIRLCMRTPGQSNLLSEIPITYSTVI